MPLSPDHHLYCTEDASDAVCSDPDTWISSNPRTSTSNNNSDPNPRPYCLSCSPFDEMTILSLIDTEHHHMPHPQYLQRCRDRTVDVTARLDSINWILRVHAHYRFSPLTALLSVNYLDRILSLVSFPNVDNGWPFQLLSVTCLSLAAKMEEPYVPFLLDLQLFDPKFVFEPKTVQRMELWVMANLDWRLRSITAFHFHHFFISKLSSSSSSPTSSSSSNSGLDSDSFHRILSGSSDLIISSTRVIDFLRFSPSTIAAAAVLCAAGESDESKLIFNEKLNKEMVKSCRQLMDEYLVDTCPSARLKADEAQPPSPIGVLDAAACRSCDTRPEVPGSSSQPERPPNKRPRFSDPDVQET